jgi:RIO kinase 1
MKGRRWGWEWEVGDKISEEVFDRETLLALRKLLIEEIETIDYPISSGKEAIVFKGEGKEGPVAIKVYKPKSQFLTGGMKRYIRGDRRFAKLPLSKPHEILYAWARKELDNLARITNAGVLAPDPIAVRKNVLVMSYIGDREAPAPLLKDVEQREDIDWSLLYDTITSYVSKMYEGGIVHGDLSEFNILHWDDKPWVIDVGQAVLTSHPRADELLRRDLERVNLFFSKKKIEVGDLSDIIKEIKER